MKNKIIFNGQSIVLTWMISYIVILLLPIAIGLLLYVESSKTLKEEIQQANDSLLKQVREVMDNQFKAMEQLNFELTWNVNMQELLYSNKYEAFPKEYLYDISQIARNLSLYKTSYPLIDSFYVYLYKDQSVILPTTVRSSAFAYQTLHMSDEFPFSAWQEIMTRPNFKGFIPMYRIGDDNKLRKSVAYVSTYAVEHNQPLATNVIMIDQSRILGAIQNMEIFNKGHVLILNNENQVLASNSTGLLPADFPYDQLTEATNLYYTGSDGEKYEIFTIQSPMSKLKYVSIMPSTVYWQKASHIRNLTYMSMAISLLGGGILTIFFLRRNYNPVRRLVHAFSKKEAMASGQRYNEFHFIQEAVDNTLLEIADFKTIIEQQRHMVRSHFIEKLLKGKHDRHIPIFEALTAFDMKLDRNEFAVMLFVVDKHAPFFSRITHKSDEDKWKLLQFIIMNVVEELLSKRHRGYATEIDDSVACLVNITSDEGESAKEELLRIAEETQNFLSATYDIHLTISISSVHGQIANVPQAFREALDSMAYKLVMGGREILAYDDLQANRACEPVSGYYYPMQVEQQFLYALKSGELEESQTILADIMTKNFEVRGISVSLTKCLMLCLITTMMKSISETGDMQESIFTRNPKLIDRLLNSKTLEDMHRQLNEMLAGICEYTSAKRQATMSQQRQKALQQLVEEISTFIEDNYSDANLNVSMIGTHFDRKATYLSKLFKDYAGEGLLDRINKVRIDKSKQLLGKQEQSVGDAANGVGFNDINAFIRVFKKVEGITPGKYKELIQK
ncbi:helix-turn-helix domain-containing protein [Paenibacillus sp. GCM10023248]|uniref:helix-turn-helix domain-containing protein n=1 Tax=Bacillales TaxID=1385 RepID=UPI0023789FD7|nr:MULTISPECIES: helix-turn-helix domain-containing protein [Bacillales]MDD9265873.1 helix-turn-helix domain-containing protein [Paenibacillus sp. MAHUQ-63]MDR6879113.1 YesN/AraC family two-component response regulator [Bacillus sp. 3255]